MEWPLTCAVNRRPRRASSTASAAVVGRVKNLRISSGPAVSAFVLRSPVRRVRFRLAVSCPSWCRAESVRSVSWLSFPAVARPPFICSRLLLSGLSGCPSPSCSRSSLVSCARPSSVPVSPKQSAEQQLAALGLLSVRPPAENTRPSCSCSPPIVALSRRSVACSFFLSAILQATPAKLRCRSTRYRAALPLSSHLVFCLHTPIPSLFFHQA